MSDEETKKEVVTEEGPKEPAPEVPPEPAPDSRRAKIRAALMGMLDELVDKILLALDK